MKTESQVAKRLEDVAGKFIELAEKVEAIQGDPPAEIVLELQTTFAVMMAIGWVLDQEEEMQKIATRVQTLDAASKLAAKGL